MNSTGVVGMPLNWLFEELLNLIFPGNNLCLLCSNPLEKGIKGLCSQCISKIAVVEAPVCFKCGKPLIERYGKTKCPDCLSTKRYFDQGRCVGEYKGILKEAVILYKYSGKKGLAVPLGFLMTQTLKQQDWPKPELIIPVPLSRKRLYHRGFNQSSLLAEVIGKEIGAPVSSRHLKRVKATEHQTKLGKMERKENVRDAFCVLHGEDIRDRRILLIDDVYTTGATVNECSRMLRYAGAASIYVLTLATGRNL